MLEQPLRSQHPTPRMPLDKQQKPFTPALSSNFRNAKSPLTPRLAGSAPNSPATQQRAFVRTRSPNREESQISLNITPRSAARKSRIGTESPATPGSTRDANVSRPRTKSVSKTSPPASAGLGISRVKSPTLLARFGKETDGEKFFRADAAKSYTSLPATNTKAKTSDEHFFYVGSDVAAPKKSPTKDNFDEKIFHASAARAQKPVNGNIRPPLATAQSASATVTTNVNKTFLAKQSPIISPRVDSAPILRRTSVGSNLSSRAGVTGHKKSMSTSSLTPTRKTSISHPPLAAVPDNIASPTVTALSPNIASSAFADSTDPPITSEPEPFDSRTDESEPPRNDDASNARRERKVLDLEISNSSLLAINKTLERELRKQNSELRRFRRLSQSGRLSLVPTERTVSTSTLGTVAEGDTSEEEESDFDDVLSNDSSLNSPTSKARQRARDEKRLMLDLSKHQQMLLDSQKLSQSIRKCLTCTEELIRDGNKAIEYRVGIGDVRLGGRVLNYSEEVEGRQGLLSPSQEVREEDFWGGSRDESEALLAPSVERLFEELLSGDVTM